MNKPMVAAQMYTVNKFTQNENDFVQSMKKVKDMGYLAVQLSGHNNVSPDCIAQTLKDTGLKACITHTSFDRMKNDLENLVKEHKMWGVEQMGVGSMAGNYHSSKEGVLQFIKEINEIGNNLAKYGMKFGYHNHSFEFKKFDGVSVMDMLINNTNENVEFIPDLYWLQNAGVSPYEWLYKVNGRVSTVHFKDMAVNEKNESVMSSIGAGNMNYIKLAEICAEIGVKFAAVEQDVCPNDPFDCLKDSLNYLISIGLR